MRPIPNYPGYLINEHGEVYSEKRNKFRKIQFNKNVGYKEVRLSLNGKLKTAHIHRLLALTFLPNPNNLPYVNHKDRNKTNNSLTNLEWCTPSQNLTHAVTGDINGESKLIAGYLATIGKKGGQSRSPKKLKAIALNAKKYDMKLSKRELETLRTALNHLVDDMGQYIKLISGKVQEERLEQHARAQALRDKINVSLTNKSN